MSLILLGGRGRIASGGGGGGGSAFFTDNFSLGNFSKTENNASWSAQVNCSVVAADSIGLVRPPSNSANVVQFRYAGAAANFAQLDAILDGVGSGYAEVYLRYWLYLPTGLEGGTVGSAFVTSSGSTAQKWLRLFDSQLLADSTFRLGAESYYPPTVTGSGASKHRLYLESGGPGFYNSPGAFQFNTNPALGWDPPSGQWVKIGWRVRCNTVTASGWDTGGDGILQLYANDALVLSTTTASLCPAGGRLRGLYLMGNNNAAFDNANTRAYIADFAASTGGFV